MMYVYAITWQLAAGQDRISLHRAPLRLQKQKPLLLVPTHAPAAPGFGLASCFQLVLLGAHPEAAVLWHRPDIASPCTETAASRKHLALGTVQESLLL